MSRRSDETDWRPRPGALLTGRAVVLSASVPHPDRAPRFRKPYQRKGQPARVTEVEIEDAVVSLARAVFAEQGRLIFGGHPSIAPLVALIAGEYFDGPAAEDANGLPHARERLLDRGRAVEVHQLDVYRGEVPDATQTLERLGHATILWHVAEPTERARPRRTDRPPYPNSLRRMREAMVDGPHIAGMVCIGGMDGVEDEARIFAERQPGRPIYAIAHTGGAAALLASRHVPGIPEERVRAIDNEVLDRLAVERSVLATGEREPSTSPYVPYPFIMQMLVRELGAGV